MSESPGSVTYFLAELRDGDPAAAEALWERFFPRLVGLARKTLAARPQRVADADDAAQSAFASFCLRARAGEFVIADRSELWRLLAAVTANKARMQLRRESAARRGGGKVISEGALKQGDNSPLSLDEAAGAIPTADLDLQCQEMLDDLDPELREIALLRLFGYRNAEIAAMRGCTERKVERKLQLIRLTWAADYPPESA